MANRSFSAGKGLLMGAALGLAAALLAPRPYVAEVSLLFPTINAGALKQVTKVLKMDGSGVEWNASQSTSNDQLMAAARLVFQSRAAVTSSLKEAKVNLPPTLVAVQGDATEYFRNHNLEVDGSDNSLRVRVSYPRAEAARSICQGLLDYYSTFVHEHRLTNTARTRQQLEEKLVRVDKRLTVLEKKLVLNAGNRYQAFTGVAGPTDSKVVRDLWKQRILEGGASGRILDEMRKIRKDAAQAQSEGQTEETVGEDWRSRWGSTTLEDSGDREGALPRNARRAELPSRLELERVYEETLVLYHAGLLQYDFLSMWEGLENFDFEVVDPVTVHQAGSSERLLPWMLMGALLGGLVGFGLRQSSRSRQDL